MAKVVNFSPAQYKEAFDWYKLNAKPLWDWFLGDIDEGQQPEDQEVADQLCDVYFNLKNFKHDIPRNFLLVGVDYKSADAVLAGKENVNLQIVNPHPKMHADQFAKNFLIAKLSQL